MESLKTFIPICKRVTKKQLPKKPNIRAKELLSITNLSIS